MSAKTSTIFLIAFLMSCSKPDKPVARVFISRTPDKRSIVFTGIDKIILNDIARDTDKNVWQGLIAVYRMPADTDMKNYQPVQPGRYTLKDSAVVFTPDTPFVNGRIYFVRNYRLGEGAKLIDYIKGRSQPGKVGFIDLIFKP